MDAISITRLHDGSYECATIHNGHRVHQRYFGYTKRECLRLFRKYLKAL